MPRSPHHVEIADRQKTLKLPPRRLIQVARSLLEAEQVVQSEISVALVDDPQIHTINRDFLQHDYPTDVISFLLDEELAADSPVPRRTSKTKSDRPRGAGKSLSGEVIISVEYASRMALKYGWSTADEVLLYLVHGLLHICGYDDLSDKELRLMRSREVAILALWNLTPQYQHDKSGRRKKKSPASQ